MQIFWQRLKEWDQFRRRGFDAPYPTYIKRRTLSRHSFRKANWIETGTYLGSTTKFLAKSFPKVTSIEPSRYFFDFSSLRLSSVRNVHLIFGTSESHFEDALLRERSSVNIWLDGHYSAGETFLGDNVSPIIQELEAISKHKANFHSICIFVDDVRLFQRNGSEVTGYPSFTLLLNWAEENNFIWEIQNDIFIAKYST